MLLSHLAVAQRKGLTGREGATWIDSRNWMFITAIF